MDRERASKEFPKDSAWHSPKGPFREALERRALPTRLRFVSEFPLRGVDAICRTT
jgi:hypothetical protein